MASGIEWTEDTWNPLTGCSVASTGCDRCYAAREAAGRLNSHPAYQGLAIKGADGVARFTGEVRTLPDRLYQPLRWGRPRLVFVNSMSDLFHPEVPTAFIAQVYGTMAVANRHTFQLLTKRPKRRAQLLASPEFVRVVIDVARALVSGAPARGWAGQGELPDELVWPLPHVWEGVSVEHQDTAWRLDHLAGAVQWVSAEPLVGPLDLSPWLDPEQHHLMTLESEEPVATVGRRRLDWVVVGGESGRDPGVRPMHPDWVRSIRDDCASSGVPFLFKQWGEWVPSDQGPIPDAGQHRQTSPTGYRRRVEQDGAELLLVGTKRAGRTLDGVVHDGYPERVPA